MPEIRPVTAAQPSQTEKYLQSINAYLIELHAKVDRLDHRIEHLLNNQTVIANGLAAHVDAQLAQMWETIQNIKADTGSGAVRMALHAGPAVHRRGDRLVAEGWTMLPGEFAFGAVGADGAVWALAADDTISRWDADGPGWQQVDGGLHHLSCPTPEQVWGVAANHQVFHRVGSSWQLVDGALATIAAAADGTVVGTATDDTIWRRYPQSGWTQLPGRLRRIAIRSANEILGVASNDQIFSWNGSDWDRLDGSACEVAIGGRPGVAPELWCVNREHQRYQRAAGWQPDTSDFPRTDRMSLAGANALCQSGSRLFVKLKD